MTRRVDDVANPSPTGRVKGEPMACPACGETGVIHKLPWNDLRRWNHAPWCPHRERRQTAVRDVPTPRYDPCGDCGDPHRPDAHCLLNCPCGLSDCPGEGEALRAMGLRPDPPAEFDDAAVHGRPRKGTGARRSRNHVQRMEWEADKP